MKAAAVILAAGRGSRMKELTANQPKCLAMLAGKPLLHWQLQALRAAGIGRICVVRGYAAHCLSGNFETAENPRWAETNMLSSLMCADAFSMDVFSHGVERLIISYSDIVYHPDHVQNLLACDQSIGITYDTQWAALWGLRFDNVLLDAETFRQENGLLKEIGGKPKSIDEIHGQYMGLLCCDSIGWKTICDVYADLGSAADRTDMTSFLRLLLTKNIPIGVVPVDGKWCEVDSNTDIKQYEKALIYGNWSHDWR